MKWLIPVMLLLLIMPVFAQDTTNIYCLDNSTANLTEFITVIANSNGTSTSANVGYSKLITCPYGCDNSTDGINDCNPDPTEQGTFMLVPILTIAIISFSLMFVSTRLNEGHGPLSVFLFLLSMAFNILFVYASMSLSDLLNVTELHKPLSYAYIVVIVATVVLFWYFFIQIIRKIISGAKNQKEEDDDGFRL